MVIIKVDNSISATMDNTDTSNNQEQKKIKFLSKKHNKNLIIR